MVLPSVRFEEGINFVALFIFALPHEIPCNGVALAELPGHSSPSVLPQPSSGVTAQVSSI